MNKRFLVEVFLLSVIIGAAFTILRGCSETPLKSWLIAAPPGQSEGD